MAFYGDELSPLRNKAIMNDINPRRPWKSGLGKMENGKSFAPIVEEREEDMSSDSSQTIKQKRGNIANLTHVTNSEAVPNKSIVFPKPRKYVTRKKENIPSSDRVGITNEERSSEENKYSSLKKFSVSVKSPKSTASGIYRQDIAANYYLGDYGKDSAWTRATKATDGALTGWPKPEKLYKEMTPSAAEDKSKIIDKKKIASVVQNIIQRAKVSAEIKAGNKTPRFAPANAIKSNESKIEDSETEIQKLDTTETPVKHKKDKKQKEDGKKQMNMRDVVNVYKNLTYGSKDEIKSFLDQLPYTKKSGPKNSEKKSMRNLKALEGKLREMERRTNKRESSTEGVKQLATESQTKKKTSKHSLKSTKSSKKSQKSAVERLSRNKVIKVPATLDYTYSPADKSVSYGSSNGSHQLTDKEVVLSRRQKVVDNKEPWRYVGRQSVLDQKYLVYPAYVPTKMKKTGKKKVKKTKGSKEEKKVGDEDEELKKLVGADKGLGKKVMTSGENQFLSRKQNLKNFKESKISKYPLGPSLPVPQMTANGTVSSRSLNRESATSICNVEFRPTIDNAGHTLLHGEQDTSSPSVLFYLHNMKAINVKSPYKNKQFSRVKLLRKSPLNVHTPLIKGQLKNPKLRDNIRKLSIRNITLPEELSNQLEKKFFDRFDFDEDIENINNFLHSQHQVLPEVKMSKRQEELKEKREPNKPECPHFQTHQHDQIGNLKEEKISPDYIINEIQQEINQLSDLPDTKENRQIVSHFFDQLDQQINATRAEQIIQDATRHYSKLIPIVGF